MPDQNITDRTEAGAAADTDDYAVQVNGETVIKRRRHSTIRALWEAFANAAVSTHAALTSGVHGISAFAATLLDDADATAARTTLGAASSSHDHAGVYDPAGSAAAAQAAAEATAGAALAAKTHPASDIVSGTLTHERGGLESDVSAADGIPHITGGATSIIAPGTSGQVLTSTGAGSAPTFQDAAGGGILDTGITPNLLLNPQSDADGFTETCEFVARNFGTPRTVAADIAKWTPQSVGLNLTDSSAGHGVLSNDTGGNLTSPSAASIEQVVSLDGDFDIIAALSCEFASPLNVAAMSSSSAYFFLGVGTGSASEQAFVRFAPLQVNYLNTVAVRGYSAGAANWSTGTAGTNRTLDAGSGAATCSIIGILRLARRSGTLYMQGHPTSPLAPHPILNNSNGTWGATNQPDDAFAYSHTWATSLTFTRLAVGADLLVNTAQVQVHFVRRFR